LTRLTLERYKERALEAPDGRPNRPEEDIRLLVQREFRRRLVFGPAGIAMAVADGQSA